MYFKVIFLKNEKIRHVLTIGEGVFLWKNRK